MVGRSSSAAAAVIPTGEDRSQTKVAVEEVEIGRFEMYSGHRIVGPWPSNVGGKGKGTSKDGAQIQVSNQVLSA